MFNDSVDFRSLTCRSDWNKSALCDDFLHGLSDYVKDELVSYELPVMFGGVIELAQKMDAGTKTESCQRAPHMFYFRPSQSSHLFHYSCQTCWATLWGGQADAVGMFPQKVFQSLSGPKWPLSLLWPGRPFSCQLSSKREGSSVSGVLMNWTPTELASTKIPLICTCFILTNGCHTLVCFIDSRADIWTMKYLLPSWSSWAEYRYSSLRTSVLASSQVCSWPVFGADWILSWIWILSFKPSLTHAILGPDSLPFGFTDTPALASWLMMYSDSC